MRRFLSQPNALAFSSLLAVAGFAGVDVSSEAPIRVGEIEKNYSWLGHFTQSPMAFRAVEPEQRVQRRLAGELQSVQRQMAGLKAIRDDSFTPRIAIVTSRSRVSNGLSIQLPREQPLIVSRQQNSLGSEADLQSSRQRHFESDHENQKIYWQQRIHSHLEKLLSVRMG